MILEFFTSYAPTINNYYAKTTRGVYISAKGRAYRDTLLKDVLEQVGTIKAISCKVRVEIIVWPPDKRRRDLDNVLKSLFDAITHAGIWEDDCLIDQMFVYRGQVVEGGRIYIKVTEAGPCIPEGQERIVIEDD